MRTCEWLVDGVTYQVCIKDPPKTLSYAGPMSLVNKHLYPRLKSNKEPEVVFFCYVLTLEQQLVGVMFREPRHVSFFRSHGGPCEQRPRGLPSARSHPHGGQGRRRGPLGGVGV